MNELYDYVLSNNSNLVSKWKHYFEVYNSFFRNLKQERINILEIGVYQGGSLKMWKSYFKAGTNIFGIDINPECKKLEEENISIYIGDQSSRQSLEIIKDKLPLMDIIIDDGGHFMDQQINTFEVFFPLLKEKGLYIVEDLHTSYWRRYNGGYKKKNTFISYSKNLIDKINAWHSEDKELLVDSFTRSCFGIHYYPSLIVIEKKKFNPPEYIEKGISLIQNAKFKYQKSKRSIFKRMKNKIWRIITKNQINRGHK